MKNKSIFIVVVILILFTNIVSAVNMTERIANCNSILNYEGITTIVGSLSLMILGFSIILHSLRVENPKLIVLGIFTAIIGFSGLVLGNYIFYVLFEHLC